MKRYDALRRAFLKFIIIITVCAILVSCGAKNPATVVSPATEVPATAVSATEIPATEIPATEIPATEIPATEAKTGAIVMPGARDFPEGVAVTSDGTFFAGSLEEGTIMRAMPGATKFEPFIKAGANGLVSVLGLYVDETNNTLWACSADADNGKLKGSAPVAIKAFDLKTGADKGSYDLPGGGFPNDLTIDDQGNVYVTDSWTPRILRLAAGGTKLEEWINDPQLGAEQWSLNGIDFDASSNVIYTVNQKAGLLFRIALKADGSAGAVTKIETSQELRRPDGLKVIGYNTLATGEGGAGGMAVLSLEGDKAIVRRIPAGLDGVATFAYYEGSAWVVENHADHFWDPANAGPDANAPFRIVEVPLNAEAIVMPGARDFPEGVAATSDGTFFAGSLEEGTIMRALPGATEFEPFIKAGANGLVSVLGLYVDEANNTLWACSADADNGKLKGSAPVAIKAFDLKTGADKGNYDLPGGGFPNDLTIDDQGNVYVTDSWTPRILRLAAGGTKLEEWINDPQLGAEQWSLNGIDFDASSNVIYTVNQKAGLLFRIALKADGSAGAVTKIETSQELRRPDGLKVIGYNTLATGEGGAGGMVVLSLEGDKAIVRRIPAGLDGVATFAYYEGSAWVVENHADHFWDPANAGPDANAPFRIVEVPLNARAIVMPGARDFPEGVAATSDGTFFAGSLEEGTIMRALPGATEFEPFIKAGANGLVSVLGLYVDEANNTLWACSADADNGKLKGSAPVAIKAFDLKTGADKGSYDLPGGGFPNDLTIDDQGNVYVTDSWTPRILRLAAGGTKLEEWINDPQLGAEQWSLNGIDFDASSNVIYTVNQKAGLLFRIALKADGSAGAVTKIKTSQELRRPDGLKVIGLNTLATGEGGAGGMAVLSLEGDKAIVRRIPAGLDGVATFAYYQGSAWVVENHADHFWDPANAGPDANAPFRIVEVPFN